MNVYIDVALPFPATRVWSLAGRVLSQPVFN